MNRTPTNPPVMHVLFFYWDLGLGGIQTKIIDSLEYLSLHYPSSVQLSLLLNQFSLQDKAQSLLFSKIPSQVSIAIDPLWRFRRFIFPYIIYFLYYLTTHKVDVIVSYNHRHNVLACAAKTILFWRKIRVIVNQDIPPTPHLSDMYSQSSKERALWHSRLTRWYPKADRIIVPTTHIKTDLQQHFGISRHQIRVISNWVRSTLNSPSQHIKKYDLLFVGRFSSQKNPSQIIRLVKLLHEKHYQKVTCCLLGSGQLKASLIRQIVRHHLQKYVFLKDITTEVSSYYQQSRLFVLTSNYEGEPLTLLEAYSYKIPIAILEYPGCDESIVPNQTGLVATNLNDLAQQINLLLKNRSKYLKLQKQAHLFAQTNHGIDNLKLTVQEILSRE